AVGGARLGDDLPGLVPVLDVVRARTGELALAAARGQGIGRQDAGARDAGARGVKRPRAARVARAVERDVGDAELATAAYRDRRAAVLEGPARIASFVLD